MRVMFAVVLVMAALAVPGVAAAQMVVEDWSKVPVGTKGIPPDWKGQSWGSPAYDFTVVDDGGKKAIHLKSKKRRSLPATLCGERSS